MIEFQGRGFHPFMLAVLVFRSHGVQVAASGGNRGRVPDDTDPAVLRQVADLDGVTVHTAIPDPDPIPDPGAASVSAPPEPTAAPKKRTRKAKES